MNSACGPLIKSVRILNNYKHVSIDVTDYMPEIGNFRIFMSADHFAGSDVNAHEFYYKDLQLQYAKSRW